MGGQLHADGGTEAEPARVRLDRERPNVSGVLPTIFAAAPVFRGALLGYDRFQVDSYVQWAEASWPPPTGNASASRPATTKLRSGPRFLRARRRVGRGFAGASVGRERPEELPVPTPATPRVGGACS
jgi:hypothetical protein